MSGAVSWCSACCYHQLLGVEALDSHAGQEPRGQAGCCPEAAAHREAGSPEVLSGSSAGNEVSAWPQGGH